MSNAKWNEDMLQFPRLLDEIRATQGNLDFAALAESMDLDADAISDLFDRAGEVWELLKEGARPVVLVVGNPFDGLRCYGPAWPNDSDLEEMTDRVFRHDTWWYAPLTFIGDALDEDGPASTPRRLA